jgi:hypothetical protein
MVAPHAGPGARRAELYYDHRGEIDEEVAQALDEEYWKRKYPPGKGVEPGHAK